jgi:hypothetical protein
MERLVTVEFGPSSSERFGKAVAEARSGAGQCSELAPNRYRTRFALDDPRRAGGEWAARNGVRGQVRTESTSTAAGGATVDE